MNTKLLCYFGNQLKRRPAIFTALVALLLFAVPARAQVAAYTLDQLQITPAYADLDDATKTVLIGGDWSDNVATNVPIGFTFKFNGIDYTQCNVSSNGFITFGSAPTITNYLPIASTETYAGAISGYGFNWDIYTVYQPGAQQANAISSFLDTSGGVGNRIFKVEYRLVRRFNDADGYISFQIWLYEGSNVIEIHFAPQTAPWGDNFDGNVNGGQIGLRGSSNSDFHLLKWGLSTWPTLPAEMTEEIPTTSGALNTDVAAIRSAGPRIPAAANRLFRFSPAGCLAPSNLTVSAVAGSTATASWTASGSGPGSYDYYLSTSSTPPTGATVPTGSTAGTTLNLSGLSSNTTYYIWVRSDCGSVSGWTSAATFTTLCTGVNIPYFLYFDTGFTVPALPPCTSNVNYGAGNNWVTTNFSEEGFMDTPHLVYNASGSQPANTWFFTRGVNLVAGNTYRLSYLYGGSTNLTTLINKLEVAFGVAPENGSMTTLLANHPNIKESPVTNVVNFTAPSTGTFYFGFHAYSAANMARLFLDDIEIVPAVCIRPSMPLISNLSYNSATATWTAPSPAPASGYAYYLSTSPTPPVNGTIPTGYAPATLLNLTGLTGSTPYYLWVQGNCGAPDMSEWSQVATFTTTAAPPYCIPAAITDNASPINNVTTTNAVTNINNSSAWVAPGYSDYTNLVVTESQGGTFNFSVGFNASGGVGVAIYIDWNQNGIFETTERMYNSAGYMYSSPQIGTITVPMTATLGITRMRVIADYWATNPNACVFGGTSKRGEIEDYTFKVVVSPPALAITPTFSTQCAGVNSAVIQLTSPIGNYNVYSWSPSTGVTGDAVNGWTINSATSLIYTLTGTQTSGDMSINTATFTYTANPLPTPITLTAANGGNVCQSGPAIALTASGGVVSGVPVYAEDFNTGAPGWTETHGTATNYLNSIWTLRPDGFIPTGPSWFGTVLHSNDNSTFYFSDNDAQGLGNPNDNKLISPVFSLAGYTAASLSFWHYYRNWTPSQARVEISTNGGASYLPAPLAVYNTVTQGTPTEWTQVVIDLTPYVGNANLRIRFNYVATWGWGWGIDNFVVSGSATSSITWEPTEGLYMDAAGTTPYVPNTGASTVYAMPSTTTTYTASASTPSPTVCTTTSATTVNVTPVSGGAATPAVQNACDGIANITLSGNTGTIVRWEWANNPTFTPVGGTIANTTATLTTAQIGTFSGTHYYRAVLSNGSCTAYSYAPTAPTYASVTYSAATWNGTAWSPAAPNATTAAIFNGNYNSTGNLQACSVQVNSGNVVFNAGHTLQVQHAVNVAGGSLTFNNDASLVQINDAATNAGNIIYRRDSEPMIQYDFTYWSSPVYPQTLANFSPNTWPDKYFWWNTTTWNWESITAPGITAMTPGQGYIIRAPQSFDATPTVFNGVFTGEPNNGVINRPVVVSGANNLNLLGNPYPSAIDADLLLSPTGPNAGILEGTIYFWTHNTGITNNQYAGGDYAVYNFSGGVGTGTAGGGVGNSFVPDGDIAAGQAFFAKGQAGGTMTFNNSMRLVGNNSDFFRIDGKSVATESSSLERHRVWLELKNAQGAYKQTLVGYIQNATDGRDNSFDGDVVDSGNPVALYSLLDTSKLAIQGRALPFNDSDQVPLGYKAFAGTFEIALSNFDGLFLTQEVYLEDKLLNVVHNLKSGPYSFTTAAGTFDDRFVLRFTDGAALSNNDNVFTENSVIVFKNDAGINIHTGAVAMKAVKIFDIRGTLIYQQSGINKTETIISGMHASQQVLLVQITSEDNRVVTRKIVY